jgi:hypothetical protein
MGVANPIPHYSHRAPMTHTMQYAQARHRAGVKELFLGSKTTGMVRPRPSTPGGAQSSIRSRLVVGGRKMDFPASRPAVSGPNARGFELGAWPEGMGETPMLLSPDQYSTILVGGATP